MPELTDEAKAAIADAVRIVHEDRQAKWLRTQIETMRAAAPSTATPPSGGPTPPPVKATPAKATPPPAQPTEVPDGHRKSAYWGIFADPS